MEIFSNVSIIKYTSRCYELCFTGIVKIVDQFYCRRIKTIFGVEKFTWKGNLWRNYSAPACFSTKHERNLKNSINFIRTNIHKSITDEKYLRVRLGQRETHRRDHPGESSRIHTNRIYSQSGAILSHRNKSIRTHSSAMFYSAGSLARGKCIFQAVGKSWPTHAGCEAFKYLISRTGFCLIAPKYRDPTIINASCLKRCSRTATIHPDTNFTFDLVVLQHCDTSGTR